MININALGDVCPIPVIKAKKALQDLATGDLLTISVDNAIATENLNKMAGELGYKCSIKKISDAHYDVTIIKTEDKKAAEAAQNINPPIQKHTVIAIGSDCMGDGDRELGTTLLKGFIYALTELEDKDLPKTILFYNAGAKTTVSGSQSVEDLRKLGAKGVEILTCGACLNFYGIAEDLAIGSVTNMYAIAEKLSGATTVIKP